MIYLIDDNKYGQMSENYKLDFKFELKLFKEHVIWLENLNVPDIELIASSASCILIHDSIENKENKEHLIALAKKNNCQYCIFSNSFTATIFEGLSIKEIKKDRMYNNLLIFINHFINHKELDLRLLSLGANYEAERASIIQDRLVNGTLLSHRNNFIYEVAFPSGSQAYKDLMELVYLSNPSLDFSSFEDTHNSNETKAQTMRVLIINMVKQVKQKYEQ